MPTDPRSHTQAMEFLFLFHACKLTNNRPDQSVSLAGVARVAGLSQDQSEQLCASLREARLIRYSALLGDICVTKFGVSEVVTTKACPHSGANYFPAVARMGLRFSRGHHLFDDLELSLVTRNQDSAQPETDSRPLSQRGASSTDGQQPISFNQTVELSQTIELDKSAKEFRQEVITELEHLLNQLGGKTPRAHQGALHSSLATNRSKANTATRRVPVATDLSDNSPSLLLNAGWKPGSRQRTPPVNRAITVAATTKKPPIEHHSVMQGAISHYEQDIAKGIEHLNDLMHRWCQTVGGNKKQAGFTGGFIQDLENINESLLHFA